MRLKKLDIFIAKQFLQLFVGTFFVCQFVLMMQFLWRYVDELIGKGLSMEVLVQFFWYMGLMLMPQAFPLASYKGCGNIADAGVPFADSDNYIHYHRLVLLPERGDTKRQHVVRTAANINEAEESGAGDSRGNIL